MALFAKVNCPTPEWLRPQFPSGLSGLTSNRASGALPCEVVMSIRPFQEQIAGLGAVALAQRLIGASLLVRGAGGIIIETEAYGQDDPASHSFRGPTQRNASMFGPTRHAYVYRSYGIHLCLNLVARPGEAVLIRALTPQVGLELMQQRRRSPFLCSGPGRLTQALGISPDDDGALFDAIDFSITLPSTMAELLVGPRIGISKAKDLPWRFGLAGAGGLSRPFPPQMP